MKNLQINARLISALSLLITMLVTSVALAQTENQNATADPVHSLFAAHCQYTLAESACAGITGPRQARSSTIDDATMARVPRRMSAPQGGNRPSPFDRSGARYPGRWMAFPSGRHALIGAVIGFGLGAAVGAKGNGGARVSLTFGALGGMMGAAFGLMGPSFHARSPYPRVPWPDEMDVDAYKTEPARSNSTPDALNPPSGSARRLASGLAP